MLGGPAAPPLKSACWRVDAAGVSEAGSKTSEPSPLERGFFRETTDGATVFFPWGLDGRGYRLGDAAAKRTAQRAVSLLVSGTLAVATWIAYRLESLTDAGPPALGPVLREVAGPLLVMGAMVAAYAVWVTRLAERLPESDLRVSKEERLREAAALAPPWKVALCGAGLAGASLLVAWLDPRAAWLGGLGAVMGGGLLLWAGSLRRAAASDTGPGADAGDPPSDGGRPL